MYSVCELILLLCLVYTRGVIIADPALSIMEQLKNSHVCTVHCATQAVLRHVHLQTGSASRRRLGEVGVGHAVSTQDVGGAI